MKTCKRKRSYLTNDKYKATDCCGEIYLYNKEPTWNGSYESWYAPGGYFRLVKSGKPISVKKAIKSLRKIED